MFIYKKRKMVEFDKAITEYNLEIEEPGAGIERFYFWILNFLKTEYPHGLGFENIYKIKDIYSATETGSYFGMVEQRKGLQQEKVSHYLGLLGNMTKTLFQIVRELRIIDERYKYYKESLEGNEESEIALKSIWVDMVEQGARNPSSVTGLASQVGFIILPDLFYKVHPKTEDEIQKYMKALREDGINEKTIEVLSRKLKQYMVWKEKTEKELSQRRNFVLKYLRQQYNSSKLYISWVRPYLRNLKKLQMHQQERPELVTAFDTSVIELEILAVKGKEIEELIKEEKKNEEDNKKEIKKKYFPCIKVTFEYVAIPQMAYQKEYQRGAIHTGVSKIKITSHIGTQEDIKEYFKKQEEEDLELLTSLNESMDAVGDELKEYLAELGEKFPEPEGEKKEEEKKETIFTPFTGIFKGFGDMIKKQKTEKQDKSYTLDMDIKSKQSSITKLSFVLYDVFKKSNRMLAW